MLSLFPSLFDYSAVAVTVLRLTVSVIFIIEGYRRLPKKYSAENFYRNLVPIIEIALGVFFFSGLFTQAVAVIFAAISLKNIFLEYKSGDKKEKAFLFYFLLFFTSLSFLFLGPGLWSIDYPL